MFTRRRFLTSLPAVYAAPLVPAATPALTYKGVPLVYDEELSISFLLEEKARTMNENIKRQFYQDLWDD